MIASDGRCLPVSQIVRNGVPRDSARDLVAVDPLGDPQAPPAGRPSLRLSEVRISASLRHQRHSGFSPAVLGDAGGEACVMGASWAASSVTWSMTQMTQDDAGAAVCVMAVVAGQVPLFGPYDADDAASSLLGQKKGVSVVVRCASQREEGAAARRDHPSTRTLPRSDISAPRSDIAQDLRRHPSIPTRPSQSPLYTFAAKRRS